MARKSRHRQSIMLPTVSSGRRHCKTQTKRGHTRLGLKNSKRRRFKAAGLFKIHFQVLNDGKGLTVYPKTIGSIGARKRNLVGHGKEGSDSGEGRKEGGKGKVECHS